MEVVPERIWRSSPQAISSPDALPATGRLLWPRRPRRQSWRCSKRSSPQTEGLFWVKVRWSWALMRPGETTALPQLTTVASAGSQPQPTQAMMPSAPMSTEPPR